MVAIVKHVSTDSSLCDSLQEDHHFEEVVQVPIPGVVPLCTHYSRSIPRMYDYYLGGKDNYEADRAAVDAVLKIAPELGFTARENRAFLGRAVRYLAAEVGIRQFLDIGTGIPTAGNTHQVAQAVAPEARVVYVDYDPVVLAHARSLLKSSKAGATQYIDADLRDAGKILDRAGQLLDFSQPVAVTLLMILHVIPDSDDPHAMVARVMDALPPGSHLAASHLGAELLDQEKTEASRVSCAARRSSSTSAAAAKRLNGSSTAWTWPSPGSSASRNGGPTMCRRASRPCGARWAASARGDLPEAASPAGGRPQAWARSAWPYHSQASVTSAGAWPGRQPLMTPTRVQ
jgi:S-adenosyl methyltransferase